MDDYKSYSFENIRVCTWSENNSRSHNDVKNGINTKQCKPVLQYDLDDNFIKEYYSAWDASRKLKVNQSNINSCLLGKSKSSYGFIWKFKNK